MERRSKCIIICSLLWFMLLRSFDISILFSFKTWKQRDSDLYKFILNSVAILFYIPLPIFSLFAEIKFGLLKTAIAITCIEAVCSLCYTILSVLDGSVIDTVTSVVVPLFLFAQVYFETLVLCFIANELTESSCRSDHFSTYVWWHVWCAHTGSMVTEVSSCLFESYNNFEAYASSVHFTFLIVIIISALFIKKWTIRYNYTVNPLKLISSVLCFALKNKYPLKRSALTYWEETEPSRINLGKAKYGGPFLEKDVESVKTFLRLTPLLIVMTMIYFPFQTLGRLTEKKGSLPFCFLFRTYVAEYVVIIISVPLYQFIIKPYCPRKMRLSILKRTGLGIALVVLAKFGYIALDLLIAVPAHANNNETICLVKSAINDTGYHDMIISYESFLYYYMIPTCINSLGALLTITGSLEFVFAQAPYSMRGLLIGLWFSFSRIYAAVGWMMVKPIEAAIGGTSYTVMKMFSMLTMLLRLIMKMNLIDVIKFVLMVAHLKLFIIIFNSLYNFCMQIIIIK
ncbi:PREDICTED: uncharacterized protein LOC109585107 [Amphimedon queenslandica]|uniref:Uncharacterized protein n=1 Tax=Amphimedon queenslandica TaxID=400682 RepID=A0AAN0JI12_AMPQE|nr:PREDICTED: uncharacterized protein LOC109585107 [Amphimedon queenslandica]|eukprot:XP_019856614.1 PREDICTED: uncharacterized protein LOC109585107 [Amphimedon queenslandica]